jgi:hypothetical protein
MKAFVNLPWISIIITFIMTLTLGSQPKQKHGKVQAKSVTRKSHLHYWSSRECE